MLKFITIALFLGAVSAAPSTYFTRLEAPASTFHATRLAAPIVYASPPLTYASPTSLTTYDSVSSPLTYTASHQPAVALTQFNPAPLTYAAGYPTQYRYAASPYEQSSFRIAY